MIMEKTQLIQKDIWLRKSALAIADDQNSLTLNNISAHQKNTCSLVNIQAAEVFKNDDPLQTKIYFYFFRLNLGVKVVTDTENPEKTQILEISAEYEVSFESRTRLKPKDIAYIPEKYNIIFEVWPYWKELVGSYCSKSGFNSLNLPPPPTLKVSKVTANTKTV